MNKFLLAICFAIVSSATPSVANEPPAIDEINGFCDSDSSDRDHTDTPMKRKMKRNRVIVTFNIVATGEHGALHIVQSATSPEFEFTYLVNGIPMTAEINSLTSVNQFFTRAAKERLLEGRIDALGALASAFSNPEVNSILNSCLIVPEIPKTDDEFLNAFDFDLCGWKGKLERAGCWAAGAAMCAAGGIESAGAACGLGAAFASFCSDAAADYEAACRAVPDLSSVGIVALLATVIALGTFRRKSAASRAV